MTEFAKKIPKNSLLSASLIIAALIIAASIFSVGGEINSSLLNIQGTQLAVLGSLSANAGTGDAGTGTVTAAGVVGEIKTFTDNGNEIELQDGKPVIRLFSTTWCPHCTWIKESFDSVVKEYEGQIVAYHWELDTMDNTLTPEVETMIPDSEQAIYAESNPKGSIPTFVFGNKYVRVGNGYEQADDLASEEAEFRAVIEALLE